jgi:23S rRNA (pseudouridine1915-N3)-methyltransferase
VPPRIDILAVGALDTHLRPAFEHYRRLLASMVTLEVREVRELSLKGRTPAEELRGEGRRVLEALPARGTVVALDAPGRAFDSETFAERLQGWLERPPVTFVIGGSLGLAPAVKEACGERLSLSPLTLPHQLARLVLAEQLYRACKIARNERYHH